MKKNIFFILILICSILRTNAQIQFGNARYLKLIDTATLADDAWVLALQDYKLNATDTALYNSKALTNAQLAYKMSLVGNTFPFSTTINFGQIVKLTNGSNSIFMRCITTHTATATWTVTEAGNFEYIGQLLTGAYTFSASRVYTRGEKVNYFGGIFERKTNGTDVTAFDPTNWTYLGGELTATSPVASALSGTAIIFREFEFRYDRNGSNGQLFIRSRTNTAITFSSLSGEFYLGGQGYTSLVGLSAPAYNSGNWLSVAAGGAGANEVLEFRILTAKCVYHVSIFNFGGTDIVIKVR